MTAAVVIALTAFLAAGLTMYSGFGLGTLMLPVFALFFPAETAVFATALVHGANNVFKVLVLGRQADREVVIRFGLPAVISAIAGAGVLAWVSQLGILHEHEFLGRTAEITPVRLVVGILMFVFAIFELLPRLRQFSFDRRFLPLGGVLSGFFGGLSGHQGALRSAFLANAGLSAGQFVGSNAVIGFLVDLTRISTYIALFALAGNSISGQAPWILVLTGAAAAICGVLAGKRYLHKVTMKSLQTLVGIMLLLVATGLITGII
jgi:uncharacterized membrane protein YfcA